MSSSSRRRLPRYTSAADLVRSMAQGNRVASTHIRLVVAHMVDQRGSLEALLEHDVLRDVVGLDITDEAWTVDALACDLLGTGFHALTFLAPPRPRPRRPHPLDPDLGAPGRAAPTGTTHRGHHLGDLRHRPPAHLRV